MSKKMKKILCIIESPGKIKKIEQILGSDYKVMASVGHIMDLDPKNMSVDIENNFEPTYIPNFDKLNIIKQLKYACSQASDVLLMQDHDREGEFIAYSVALKLGLKNPKRIIFNSITKSNLISSINNPQKLDYDQINSQKTRRILDRIVGYELSPLLDKHFSRRSLSAGRVQSVVARLIIDKEEEIKNFFSSNINSFFKIVSTLLFGRSKLIAQLHNLEKKMDDCFKGDVSKIESEEKTLNIINQLIESNFKVAYVFTKKRIQNPPPPFTTSTLQQDANRKFKFTGKKTMSVAQKLYEAGHITYMRTDSTNLSEEALDAIKDYIIKNYGNEYYKDSKQQKSKSKDKHIQEAHEAIRPTDVNILSEKLAGDKISNDEKKLYDLIWKRTIASQMKPAEYDVISIQISISKNQDYFFMSQFENLTFNGFLEVIFDDENEDSTTNISNIVSKDQRITKPILTKYERTRLLGDRTQQITLGAKPMIKNVDKLEPKKIAELEIEKNVIPLIIERPRPDGKKERFYMYELEH